MGITDNILSEEDFKALYDEVMSEEFPWYYGRKVYSDDECENFFLIGWKNTVVNGTRVTYDPNNIIVPMAKKALINAGEDLNEIVRLRIVLNTASDKNYLNGAHVDLDHRHRTALLYLNDSDGSTILYNEKFDPTDDYSDSKLYMEKKLPNFTIQSEVEPKRNRLFIFNGLNYHSGTTPTTVARRVLLNINYTYHPKK